jgi:peroxiredoxin
MTARSMLLSLLVVVPALAGPPHPEDMQTLNIGDPAPDFDLPGVDGERYTLADFAEAKLLMVMFTCNHCPTAQAVEERLKHYVRDYRPKGVAVVAISPNAPAGIRPDEMGYSQFGDSFEDMVKHAQAQDFNFPYLYDGDTQSTAKAYGCLATPHVFLFDAERKLRYQGRFDDSRFAPPDTVKHHDAILATDALLKGAPVPVAETRPHGCSTKWAFKAEDVKAHAARLAATPITLETIDADGLKKLFGEHPRLRMVNVWATWCAPCTQEFPDLVAVARKFGRRDFEFVTLSLDTPEDLAKAKAFLERQAAAPEPKLARTLENEGRATTHFLFTGSMDQLAAALDPGMPGAIPHTVLINARGEVVYRHTGLIDREDVVSEIVARLGRYYTP